MTFKIELPSRINGSCVTLFNVFGIRAPPQRFRPSARRAPGDPVHTSRLMSLPSRLANLSYAQLLGFAVDACESSPKLRNKADALIAEVAPLPSWCVDVLLSPDLLPQLFSSLGLSEHAAAGVCTTWSRAYSRHLRRCRYINPSVRQLAVPGLPALPIGICMLPGGVLAIASSDYDCTGYIKFVAARNNSDRQALAACRASSLATVRFRGLMGLAHTNDGLLVCSYTNRSTALYKMAQDGSTLATVPALANYDRGFRKCAVHQQTQRTYAIGEANKGNYSLVLLDANLQVITTVETTGDHQEDYGYDEDYEPIRDVAVHGDQVIVLTDSAHDKGSGLRLLDLDGRFLRTIAAGQFRSPQAVTASHGTAFVVDDDDYDDVKPGKVLHVIDIQSGDILQRVRLDLQGCITAIRVDGDEIFVADFNAGKVVVLRRAGSEL